MELFAEEANGIPGEFQGQKEKFILYFIPEDAPTNFILVPQMRSNTFPITCVSNSNANESPNSSVTSPSTANVGFKELCLKKIDSIKQTSASNNPQKRRKVNPYGSIVTRSEEFDEPLSKKKSAAAANKAKNYDDESKEEEENVLLEEGESSSEIEEEETEEEEGNSGSSCKIFPPVNYRQAILYLRSTWSEINLPAEEKDLQGKYFAAIYYPDGNRKKKPKLFVAKFLNHFLADEDGATSSVNLDCPFEVAISSPTVLPE